MEGLAVNPGFWRGKRVLLTGHTGFKGSWLSIWLSGYGALVKGFALDAPTAPSLFKEAGVSRLVDSFIGDVRNFDTVLQVFKSFMPEIVIHMAAQPLVRYSYENPLETYATNVLGTAHVLEAARKAGSVQVIVNVTTDKCYENREWVWGYREDEPMGGFDPYSSSKACSELVTSAYRRSFLLREGIALASARAGNVIGGGDWARDRLIPDVLAAFCAEAPVLVRNPLATRPWQHVLEPLSGYMCLAEKLWEAPEKFSGAWNFGPNDEDAKPVRWVVERLADKWQESAAWTIDESTQPHEAHYLKLDISKARHALGWSPRWSIDHALDKVVCWHKAWLQKEDTLSVCRQQIAEFCAS